MAGGNSERPSTSGKGFTINSLSLTDALSPQVARIVFHFIKSQRGRARGGVGEMADAGALTDAERDQIGRWRWSDSVIEVI